MRLWVVTTLALAFLVCRAQAVFEGLVENEQPKKQGFKSFLNMINPTLKSLCNLDEFNSETFTMCQQCTSSLTLLVDHVIEQRTWAVMMLDALAKPPTGLLSGTFSLVSHYDQCMKIPEFDTDYVENVLIKYPNLPSKIRGTYCSFKLRLKRNSKFVRTNDTLSEFQEKMKSEEGQLDDVYKLQPEFPGFIGLCLPSACQTEAFNSIGRGLLTTLGSFLSSRISKFPMIVGVEAVACVDQSSTGKIATGFSAKTITGILTTLAILVVIGTIIDAIVCYTMDRDTEADKTSIQKHSYDFAPRGALVEMLRQCSAVVSFRILMNPRLPDNTVKCLNGVKFCAIFWLIMGNTGSLRAGNMTTNMKEMQKALETVTTQFVLNKDLAVDSLFVVTGILLAYGLAKKDGAGHIFSYTAHRLIKTVPMYFLLIWFLICCFAGLGSGPTWEIEKSRYLKNCPKYWWTNFLFINNFVKVENQCIPHTWLVAMSLQGFLVAVISAIFWKVSENVTHFVLGCLVVCTMIIDFFLNLSYNLGPTTLLREYRPGSRNDYMSVVGMQLYSRGGPFLIGLIIGFIFNQKVKSRRAFAKLNKIPTAFMWLMILTTFVVTINATFNWNRGVSHPSRSVSAMYDAFHRVVFALSTGLLVMMCHAGKGGIINMFLSWPGFVPVSRVWLLIYLVHPFVIFHGNGTLRAPVYYTKKQLFIEIIWNFIVSFVVSIVLHILLVRPFQAIENYIYRKLNPDTDDLSNEFYPDSRYVPPVKKDPELAQGSSVRSSPSSTAKDEKPEPYAQHKRDLISAIDASMPADQQEKLPLMPSMVRNSLSEHTGTGSLYKAALVDTEIEIDDLMDSPRTLRKNMFLDKQ